MHHRLNSLAVLFALLLLPALPARAGTGPALQITSPAGGSFLREAVDVTGSAACSWRLQYATADTGRWQQIAAGDPYARGTFGTLDTRRLQDGAYDLQLIGSCPDGTMPVTTLRFYVDNTAPSAGITGLAYRQTVSGDLWLYGRAADANLQFWTLDLLREGAPLEQTQRIASAESVGPNGLLTRWNTRTVPNGTYTIILQAADRAGNYTTDRVDVQVSNPTEPPPTIELLEPVANSVVSGVVTISARTANADRRDLNLITPAGRIVPLYALEWDTTRFPDGYYALEAIAYAGEDFATDKVYVTVDNTPPVLTAGPVALPRWVTAPGPSVTVRVRAEDATLTSMRLALIDQDGRRAAASMSAYGPNYLSISLTPPVPDGTYRLVLQGTDGTGHSSELPLGEFGLQLTQPDPPVPAPLPPVAKGHVRLAWQPGRSTAGVAGYKIWRSRDGGPYALAGETTALTWTDEQPPAGLLRYRVVQESPSGLTASADSSPVTIRTSLPSPSLGPAVPIVTEPVFTLNWTPSTPDALYDLYRDGPDGVHLLASGLTGTTYQDRAAGNVIHRYWVVARDAAGNEAASEPLNILFAHTLPSQVGSGDRLVYVAVKGALIRSDVPAFTRGDRTWLPLRFVAEALGAGIRWDAPTATATVTGSGGEVLTVTEGSPVLRIAAGSTERHIAMDAAPFTENGRIYVPVRYLAEALGCTVEWDGETGIVRITTGP